VKYLLLGTVWMLLAAVPLAWCAPNEGADRDKPAVRLRDAVEVKRSWVRLSDLLPPDAPSALQKAGAAIELCQAPQPGSARVFDAEQIASKLAGQPEVLHQLSIPAEITVRNSGWPIAEATVRIAISKFLREPGRLKPGQRSDLPDAARLEGLKSVAAAEEHPSLQMTGLAWDNRQQSVQVRLRCSRRASCGSFLVHVILPAALGDEWHNRMESAIGLNSPEGAQLAATEDGTALAKKGKPAILILDDGSMRILVRVVCLQRGMLNQQIRVFDAKSRRVFHAEVVGAGELHGTL
jgi:hypothetical protein